MSPAPDLYGLVLVGGRSTRMGRDKAALRYGAQPQAVVAYELLAKVCRRVFLSTRSDQDLTAEQRALPQIRDLVDNIGPMGGILSALETHPDRAWLVLACDLPFLTEATLRDLVARRDPAALATAYRSAHDGKPEPLCAIYEPAVADRLREFAARDERCPRNALIKLGVRLLDLPDPRALDNVNQPQEYDAARSALSVAGRSRDASSPAAATRAITIRYYAMLREQAQRDAETRTTTAPTAGGLYAELARQYRFTMPANNLRVAINGAFVAMDHPLPDGAEVTFIPPVAGG